MFPEDGVWYYVYFSFPDSPVDLSLYSNEIYLTAWSDTHWFALPGQPIENIFVLGASSLNELNFYLNWYDGTLWYETPNNLCCWTWTEILPVPCSTWTSQTTCEDAGCFWYNNSCHDSVICDQINNITDCLRLDCVWQDGKCQSKLLECTDYMTKSECEDHFCYWWNASCHSHDPLSCADLNNEIDCLAYKCEWYDGACHSKPPCDQHTSQSVCEAAGCRWWNNACHDAAPTCGELNNQSDCERYGCSWYDGSCHSAIVCEDILTQTECETAKCYWYDGSCHSSPSPPPPSDWMQYLPLILVGGGITLIVVSYAIPKLKKP